MIAQLQARVAVGPRKRTMVEYQGAWFPAEILQVKDGKFLIHYVGSDARWDEWVTKDRILPAEYLELVLVEWGGDWFPAGVLRVNGRLTLVHYLKWEAVWDEWVPPDRIQPYQPGAAAAPPRHRR